MGNTTVIELDHDLSHEIRENPEEFIRQILDQLGHFAHSSYTYTKSGVSFINNEILGGKVIAGFHRSGIIDETWNKCKVKMNEVTKGQNNH